MAAKKPGNEATKKPPARRKKPNTVGDPPPPLNNNLFPDYPDAGEPCVNNQDLVLIARCVNGLRVLMWVSSTELGA